MRVIYVAGKYTAKTEFNHMDKAGISKNIYIAELASWKLWKKGWAVITPHKNTSHFERYEDDELSYEAWINGGLELLNRSDAIFMLNNWEDSPGSRKEFDFAKSKGKQIFYEKDGIPSPDDAGNADGL